MYNNHLQPGKLAQPVDDGVQRESGGMVKSVKLSCMNGPTAIPIVGSLGVATIFVLLGLTVFFASQRSSGTSSYE
jgi:hypothetical protein